MKKLVIILLTCLFAAGVQAQDFGHGPDRHDRKEMGRGRRDDRKRDRRDDRKRPKKLRDNKRGRSTYNMERRGMARPINNGKARMTVVCEKDWQTLWNGCHVRILSIGKVAVCEKDGDRILQADEIHLLTNGYYKIRNGSFWYICEPDGDKVFNLWGDSIVEMEDGIYRCYRGGIYHYYDVAGNEYK